VKPEDIRNTEDYIGQDYGVPTPRGIEMIKLLARTEGIFLDPVYTSKAMSGLADHIQQGKFTESDIVIFLHTGGNSAIFAYQDELDLEELKSHVVYD
jgi:1-aminocyclopropane-1-carboxylate deaminase/D-cysteine desulfhydrase-like pyridoxal-dependent ACC family enzyme